MRKPILSVAVPMVATMMCVAVATAATLSYTPNGDPPYDWSNTANWGGTLPGSGDEAKANNSLLLANPLNIVYQMEWDVKKK